MPDEHVTFVLHASCVDAHVAFIHLLTEILFPALDAELMLT